MQRSPIVHFVSILVIAFCCSRSNGQAVGDCVRLRAFSQLGVPLHAGSGEHGVSARLPDQTIAKIDALDSENGWLLIRSGGQSGWIIRKYVDAVVACAESPPLPAAGLTYRVGCWNLEHCNPGSTRGFPENTRGGPTFEPRTLSDFESIAGMIEAIDAKLLLLSEIGGEDDVDDDGGAVALAPCLDELVSVLGSANYDYAIGSAGGKQRLAIFYDRRCVRLNTVCETDFPLVKVQGKALFDRQPLIAHVTLLHEGREMNDLVVVAVHLASGQHLTENHDRAMELVQSWLDSERPTGTCFPENEFDVFIAGDFNANRFDDREEECWDQMEADGWDVLADVGDDYPATRLSGVPLESRDSKIDYIIVSAAMKGDEVSATTATVHTELIGASAEAFRRRASDHLPVTVPVSVVPDSD